MSLKFNCHCCGHCCLNLIDAYNGVVSDADLLRWKKLERDDLLEWVVTLELGPDNLLHTAWVDPVTGDDVERCPWVLDKIDGKGHLCGIDSIKPDHCRAYPEHQKHAESTGCRGYDKPVVSKSVESEEEQTD